MVPCIELDMEVKLAPLEAGSLLNLIAKFSDTSDVSPPGLVGSFRVSPTYSATDT